METAASLPVRSYPPSWLDRLLATVDSWRVPGWGFYLGLALAGIPVFVAADLLSDAFPPLQVLPFHLFLATLTALTIWFTDYLDRTAERALDQTVLVLKATPEEVALLRYELTTMPALPVLLLTILGPLTVLLIMALVFALDPADSLLSVMGVTRTTPSLGAFVLFVGLAWAVGFVFLFHAARQLRLIRRIYDRYVVVDLNSPGPLYAFSRVSALTAAGLQLQSVLWIVTNPAAGGAFLPIVFLSSFTFVAAVIFIVPLWGIHRRIVDEKARQLGENAHNREALISQLRVGNESGDLGRATQIKDAVLAFDIEAKALAGVRTWPWEPETLRLLLTAVLLPTALFVLQYVVRLLLGG